MPLSIRYASLALRTLSLLDLMILVDCKTVLRHALPISLLILRKKPTVLQSMILMEYV